MACPTLTRELDMSQGCVPCTSGQGGAFGLMVERGLGLEVQTAGWFGRGLRVLALG